MADTKRSEKTAENHFASDLDRLGFLIARPEFDQHGADLLGFIAADNKGYMCRIQSKYRDCRKRSQVEVPAAYIKKAFLLCLYLVTRDGVNIAYMLPEEIRERFTRVKNGGKPVYRLSLSPAVAEQLGADSELKMSPDKVSELKRQMVAASALSEMTRDAGKVLALGDKAIKAGQKVRRLEQLLHKLELAELQLASTNEQLETLNACKTLLQKHGIGGAKRKRTKG